MHKTAYLTLTKLLNSDTNWFKEGMKLKDIPSRISDFMDLTKSWKGSKLIEEKFTDQ